MQDDGQVTTLTGVALDGAGTPIYADPRRLLADPAPADDIYALGMIGVQLLLGDLFRPVPHDWIDDAEEIGASEDLIAVLQRSIGRAERRPADASAFLDELGEAPSYDVDTIKHQQSDRSKKKNKEPSKKNVRSKKKIEKNTQKILDVESHSVFRDTLKNGGRGPEMAVIPTGRFLMGSPENELDRQDNEGPQHEVIIDQSFALARYATTIDEYNAFCDATGRGRSVSKGEGSGCYPVTKVSWDDAVAFCAWLLQETGFEYRLPSEAEWEYACRAGSSTAFCPDVARRGNGEFITTEEANFRGTATYHCSSEGVFRKGPVPVDHVEFRPNGFGLWQMHGNVWEWCADDWDEDYKSDRSQVPFLRSPRSDRRVLRGGSWYYISQNLRSAIRYEVVGAVRYGDFGFRPARTLLTP